MHCPVCGQKQINTEIRFCSRCGFLLSDVAEIVANNGISPYKIANSLEKKDSPRKRGIKFGGMIMLVGCLLVVPIISILFPFLKFPPFIIPLAAILSFMGGLLRIIYAFMFESNMVEYVPYGTDSSDLSSKYIKGNASQNALPPQQSIPISDFAPPAGSWRETKDLVQPPSVIEDTTKFLKKEQ